MKYLKTVILDNFQSHKHTVIDFDERLNVIVGPSDSGKSAVIRGIKWALYNEPSGDYFIREGESDVAVTLIFNDNTKIKRYRSKSKNQYILYNHLGEEIKYEGFGLGVPREIVEKIGIEKIYLDSEETNSINLGEQLEGAFLLSEKTSTRASAIGRLIGVNIIDDALKETLKDVRSSSIEKKNKDSYITSIKEELRTFDYLEELNNRLSKLEKIKEKIKLKERKKDKLIKLSSQYLKYKKELKLLNFYLEKLNVTKRLDEIEKDIQILNRDYVFYNNKNTKFKFCKSQIHKNNLIIENLKDIDRVSEIQDILNNNLSLKKKLFNIKSKDNSIKLELKSIDEKILKLKGLSDIEDIIDNSNDKITYLIQLKELNNKYKSKQNSIKIGKKYIHNFKDVDKVDKNYNVLEKNINYLTKLYNKKDLLAKIKKNINNEKNEYEKINNNMQNNLYKYKEILKQSEVCPLCLSNIDDVKLNHIIDHFK